MGAWQYLRGECKALAVRTPCGHNRPMPRDNFTLRLDGAAIDRAAALVDKARDWPCFALVSPSLSGVLRLALARGLDALEASPQATKGSR